MSKEEADTAAQVEDDEEEDDGVEESPEQAAAQLKEQEKKLLDKYGKIPSAKPKATKQRKFFDSGDYEANKAKKGNGEPVGVGMPDPANIPHSVPKGVATKPEAGKAHSSLGAN